jgi:hypothetical protein
MARRKIEDAIDLLLEALSLLSSLESKGIEAAFRQLKENSRPQHRAKPELRVLVFPAPKKNEGELSRSDERCCPICRAPLGT